MRFHIVLLIAVAAFAGCDRREKPMNTAAQQATPQVGSAQPSAAPSDAATRPDQTASAPKPDSETQKEPQVQGQADARQGDQKQHFDNKR